VYVQLDEESTFTLLLDKMGNLTSFSDCFCSHFSDWLGYRTIHSPDESSSESLASSPYEWRKRSRADTKAEVVKTLVESTGQEHCDQKYSHTLLIVHKGRCFKVYAEATRKDLHPCNT